jgi:fibrillarin-like pre-rRNA processing protein
MKQQNNNGIYHSNNKIYTLNPTSCKNIKVYGENLKTFQAKQYRSWNPYRSKLAAVLTKKDLILPLKKTSTILYLGAATGTTVSHLADICIDGWIYTVEPSPVTAKTLMILVKQRNNIIPIIEDANHPDRYKHNIIEKVDYIYQDISQRNQAEIFASNVQFFLKDNGEGILMVKARSINVAMKPSDAFSQIEQQLTNQELKIENIVELSPYEKDHAAFFIKKK